MSKICPELIIKTLYFLMLKLNRFRKLFWYFHSWIWTSKCQLGFEHGSINLNCSDWWKQIVTLFPCPTWTFEDFSTTFPGILWLLSKVDSIFQVFQWLWKPLVPFKLDILGSLLRRLSVSQHKHVPEQDIPRLNNKPNKFLFHQQTFQSTFTIHSTWQCKSD